MLGMSVEEVEVLYEVDDNGVKMVIRVKILRIKKSKVLICGLRLNIEEIFLY